MFETFLVFLVFLFSVIIHEITHGFVAEKLGDPTARLAGRLTFNPLVHLDIFGSIILPLSLFLMSKITGGPGIIFGWAKPVPYNPLNFQNFKKDVIKVALAGPLINILIALIFAFIFNLHFFNQPAQQFLAQIVYINLLLGIFNIFPLPPLDGSKILVLLLPKGKENLLFYLELYGFLFIIVFIFLFWPLINFIVKLIFNFLIG